MLLTQEADQQLREPLNQLCIKNQTAENYDPNNILNDIEELNLGSDSEDEEHKSNNVKGQIEEENIQHGKDMVDEEIENQSDQDDDEDQTDLDPKEMEQEK